jgi:glycosyltransferase involved in cell wall biosynthesis
MSNFIEHHKLIHVRLLDFQDKQSLAQLFRGATASIMPSQLPENCPNIILESAAQSCPVIASDVGGVSELINDGHDGWLIPPGQPDRLASAMSQAFTDPQLSARLSSAAAQRIVQHHHPDSFYHTLIEIYHRAQERHQ